MITFEEQIVKSYYNLKNYFTIENIPFSARKKSKGGKGRGEIDLIAVKLDKNSGIIKDIIHIEITASIVEKFPFVSKYKGSDEIYKLLKKFFINNSDEKLKEFYLGKWRYQFVTSRFRKNIEILLRKRLKYWGAKITYLKEINGELFTRIEYDSKCKEIEITPFTKILGEFKEKMKDKTEHYLSTSIRAMQWWKIIESTKAI